MSYREAKSFGKSRQPNITGKEVQNSHKRKEVLNKDNKNVREAKINNKKIADSYGYSLVLIGNCDRIDGCARLTHEKKTVKAVKVKVDNFDILFLSFSVIVDSNSGN